MLVRIVGVLVIVLASVASVDVVEMLVVGSRVVFVTGEVVLVISVL